MSDHTANPEGIREYAQRCAILRQEVMLSPATILALLAERDALAARLDAVEKAARELLDWGDYLTHRDDPGDPIPRLVADVQALAAILDNREDPR